MFTKAFRFTLNRTLLSISLSLFLITEPASGGTFLGTCFALAERALGWTRGQASEQPVNQSPEYLQYLASTRDVPAEAPLKIAGRRITGQRGIHPEQWEAIQTLSDIMGRRDEWVRWNINLARSIRERARIEKRSYFETMVQVLKDTAKESGFPEEILILEDKLYDRGSWLAILRQGKVFIDSTFTTPRGEGAHTSIAHALQLLWVESQLQQQGHPKGTMSRYMREVLGNPKVAEVVTLGVTHPWGALFDSFSKNQVHSPEWFGELVHTVAPDIPYETLITVYKGLDAIP